jgi:hypothetical protein
MTDVLLPIIAIVFLLRTHTGYLVHSISYPMGTEDLGNEAVRASRELLDSMWSRGEQSGGQYVTSFMHLCGPSACMKPSLSWVETSVLYLGDRSFSYFNREHIYKNIFMICSLDCTSAKYQPIFPLVTDTILNSGSKNGCKHHFAGWIIEFIGNQWLTLTLPN